MLRGVESFSPQGGQIVIWKRSRLLCSPGVNTIIQILSESRRSTGRTDRHDNYPRSSALSTLKIERLVIQPVDARLEFVHALRVWLRENGWQITQVHEVPPLPLP